MKKLSICLLALCFAVACNAKLKAEQAASPEVADNVVNLVSAKK